MVNYSNGKIYKIEPICEHDEGDVYFGSTTKQYLSQRMENHRSDFKNNKMNAKCSSKLLFEKYNVENCVIILLESVNAKTKDELVAIEAKYIINNKCVNKQIPLRTNKIYYNDNVEKICEQKKVYYNDNAEKIKEQREIYYNDNVEKMKEKNKIYYDNNAEKIKEQKKIYYNNNVEKMKQLRIDKAEYLKEYAIKNRDKIKEYQRQYNLKQKEQKANAEN